MFASFYNCDCGIVPTVWYFFVFSIVTSFYLKNGNALDKIR